jgi:hypothetical protein
MAARITRASATHRFIPQVYGPEQQGVDRMAELRVGGAQLHPENDVRLSSHRVAGGGRSSGKRWYERPMRRLPFPSIVLGSLVGAAAIHLTMAACSDPTRSAQAADCASYQVAGFYQPSWIPGVSAEIPAGLTPVLDMPAGWEPISGSPFGGGDNHWGAMVMVRRCSP